MIMMIEEPEMERSPATEADKPITKLVKELVEDLQDGEIISIPLEGMVISDGQET